MARSFLVVLLLFSLGCSRETEGPPYSPQEARQTLEVHPDFEVELFAAEPLIADPIAIEFAADGTLWVLESSGYPLDVEGRRGRVKRLSDTDGDGRPDAAVTFAEDLVMPSGLMEWKNGVIVTDPPDVLYLVDVDGDGRADERRALLTGFAASNPQHTVSSPVFGLDNWIYLSHGGVTTLKVFGDIFGDTGDEIHFPDQPNGPRLPIEKRSVRFRPDSYELEMLAGSSQFGSTFDAFGQLFTHDNSNHARHEPIAARYLERHPAFRLERPWHTMFVEGVPAEVYPITRNPRFEMLTNVGVMTSGCGLTRYLGGALPGFEDLAVVGEPAHNLVHADRWSRNGATFQAERLEPADREFLASTDSWFRPVNFAVGPDGALYVVDYYRQVIEHPEWMSEELYDDRETLYGGDDRGRIWRVTPKGGLAFERPRLDEASTEELVERLSDPNLWYRRTAQRLLIEGGGREGAAKLLREALEQETSAAGRTHLLWTLHGFGALEWEQVRRALEDPEPGVVRNAVLLAELLRERAPPGEWLESLLAVEENPDPHVRRQLLLTLGYSDSSAARAFRDRALAEGFDDPWIQAAALTWPDSDPLRLLTGAEPSEAGEQFVERVASMAGAAGDRTTVRALMAAVSRDRQPWRQAAALRGLTETVEAEALGDRSPLIGLLDSGEDAVRAAALELLEKVGMGRSAGAVAARASETAFDSAADSEKRAQALRLLALADPAPHRERLKALLADPQTPGPVQAAAARAYGRIEGEAPAEFLIALLRTLAPEARADALEAFYTSDERMATLLRAVADGQAPGWMLDFRQKRRLLMHSDAEFRKRARQVFRQDEAERRRVLDRYAQGLAETEADAARGRSVFQRVCKECHPFRGEGAEVGPDLATVATRPAQAILTDILLPNASIAQQHEAYVVETFDGRILDGVLGAQTPTTITLVREGGEKDVVERSEIREMRAMQLSAMPENLEERVSAEEMAHLIHYIKSR